MNLDMGKHAIIRLFNVTKHYGGRPALQNVSMDILPGEFVFVSGPSGAGKSTLLKVLYLAETVSDGQILIDGMNLSRISAGRLPFLRRRFGMVFQDFKLIPTLTVFDNVALALEVAGKKPGFIKKKVMHVLRITGMEKKARDLPPTLSGGEQQRVAVARAVVGTRTSFWRTNPPAAWIKPLQGGYWKFYWLTTRKVSRFWWPAITFSSSGPW